MISFLEAREIVLAQARSFGVEKVTMAGTYGRVLAEPILADRDYPPFPRATMDGYALRHADLEKGILQFRIVETLFAGSQAVGRISVGECYKIMTGAAVPGDADLVVRREDAEESGRVDADGGARAVTIGMKSSELWRPWQNIARQGEDLRAGDVVIGKPCRLNPAVMGLMASLGYVKYKVAKTPKVGIITTGDEVVHPGMPMSPVQIRNSNLFILVGSLMRIGVLSQGTSHASDDPEHLREVLGRFLGVVDKYDILILTGGVSAGDADHVPRVLTEAGVRPLFHKIAMRPGKPTWCGLLPEGGIVFALPGNPFSCLVNFALFIAPYIDACWGLEQAQPISLPLREPRKKRTPLDEFFPVRMEGAPAMLTQLPLNGSGDIRLGMGANALALHPAGVGDLGAGEEVAFYSFV